MSFNISLSGPAITVAVQAPSTFAQSSATPSVATVEEATRGPKGDPGTGTTAEITFYQDIPASTWAVAHNLGKFPSVRVVDSAGTLVFGDVQYVDSNNLNILFSSNFAGIAYIGD